MVHGFDGIVGFGRVQRLVRRALGGHYRLYAGSRGDCFGGRDLDLPLFLHLSALHLWNEPWDIASPGHAVAARDHGRRRLVDLQPAIGRIFRPLSTRRSYCHVASASILAHRPTNLLVVELHLLGLARALGQDSKLFANVCHEAQQCRTWVNTRREDFLTVVSGYVD